MAVIVERITPILDTNNGFEREHNKNYGADIIANERIDYWYSEKNKAELLMLLNVIEQNTSEDIRPFFLTAFSSILKSCSIWQQRSNKPTRDFAKRPAEPWIAYLRQVKKMMLGAEAFHELLQTRGHLDTKATIHCGASSDCAEVDSESVDLIVTSPPYSTSYEYADLHQLSALWFTYTKNLSQFRSSFIGSGARRADKVDNLFIQPIIKALSAHNNLTALKISAYFNDMNATFMECKRILRSGGRLCIVIGDTCLHGVSVPCTAIFIKQLLALDFQFVDVLKREIPSKNIPSIRDSVTGRFVSANTVSSFSSYPHEQIIIVEKS